MAVARCLWTRESITEAIRTHYRNGHPIHVYAVSTRCSGLAGAASRLFGGWNQALQAAGFTPRDHVRKYRLSPAEVIDGIRTAHAQGIEINVSTARDTMSRLHTSALRCFGSWDRAVAAAGLDPALARKIRFWSRDLVLDLIRAMHKRGESIVNAHARKNARLLFGAAERLFGRWRHAVVAAGLPEHLAMTRRTLWTREEILTFIKDTHAAGGRLNFYAHARNSVTPAAKRMFGSWNAALAAAGLDPASIRAKPLDWTKDAILDAIMQRHVRGETLQHRKAGGLYYAATRHFGSWDEALEAAGCDPAAARVCRKPWTRSEVLLAIRHKAERGEELIPPRIRPVSLLRAGKRYFDSWPRAIRQAGLDPARVLAPKRASALAGR